MHTGRFCTVAGEYETSCPCAVRREFERGEELPQCPRCGRSVEWRQAPYRPGRRPDDPGGRGA